jgi:CubicO group peptidase (beta-lactamase class C family)
MFAELLSSACDRAAVPGAVLAISSPAGVESVVAGVASIADNELMTPDHQFPAMSIVKSMTASIAADLVREGVLSIGATVDDVLPSIGAPWASQVTVRHLLACEGGLPAMHIVDTGEGDDAIAAYASTVGELPLLHEPGTRFSYSNTGYAIAAALLEAASARTFDDLVQERILDRADMAKSGSWYRAAAAAPVVQHIGPPGGSPQPIGWWRLRACTGAGSGTIFLTAEDLARYGRHHIPAWPELRVPQQAFPGPHAEAWGLGWALYGWGADVFGWDGVAPGARAFLRVLPHHDAAVALLANGSNGRGVYREVMAPVLEERFGVRPAPESWEPTDGGPPDDAVLGQYGNGNAAIRVARGSDGLQLTDSMGGVHLLRPAGPGRYVGPDHLDYPTVEHDFDALTYFCSVWMRR